MAGTAGLDSMEPLTDAESLVVAVAVRLLYRTLGESRFRPFVGYLGRERCYDAGVVALMRAVKCWKAELSPFDAYSKIWLRKYLIQALSEAAAANDMHIPADLRCWRLPPDQQAENAELIAAAFRVLPKRQREVMMLRSAGLTWPEVAKSMSCCLNLVRRYHVRAMTRIWRLVPEIRGV